MNEILEYLKNIVDEKDNLQPFPSWLKENEEKIENLLNRGSYLKLKNEPIFAIRSILKKSNIEFDENKDFFLPCGPGDYSWIDTEWLMEEVRPDKSFIKKYGNLDSITFNEMLCMLHLKETHDKIYYFCSPNSTWKHKMGRSGIALVRGQKVIYALLTVIN